MKKKKPKKSGFTWKDTEKANDIFSDVGGTLAELERKLNTLKQGTYCGIEDRCPWSGALRQLHLRAHIALAWRKRRFGERERRGS